MLDLWPTDASKAQTEFETPEGYKIRITYSVTAPSLLLWQLSKPKLRKTALQSLLKVSTNRQLLMDYLSLPALVSLLVLRLRKSIKGASASPENEDPATALWTLISSDLRLTRRCLESCPDLVDSLWNIIRKDKDSHAQNYLPIILLLKQFSGFPGGSDLLPETVTTFERSVANLGPDSYELLLQIVPLLTYFDPKYAQYCVTRTNAVATLARAFNVAFEAKLPHAVFDQLFALVRYFGSKYAPNMKEAGIFDAIQQLTVWNEQSRVQLAAIQISSLFGLELHDTSIESLLVAVESDPNPLSRVKASVELEKVLSRAPPPAALRVPIALVLISSLKSPIKDLSDRAFLLLASLQLTCEECLQSGIVKTYHAFLAEALKSPFLLMINNLEAVFEILLGAIFRSEIQIQKISLPKPSTEKPQSKIPTTLTRGHLDPAFLKEAADLGIFTTLRQGHIHDTWLTHHLAFWVFAHHGIDSLTTESQEFYNGVSEMLEGISKTVGFEGPHLLDIAAVVCLRELRTRSAAINSTIGADSTLQKSQIRKLKDSAKLIKGLLTKELKTSAACQPSHWTLYSYDPRSTVSVSDRIKSLLSSELDEASLTLSAENSRHPYLLGRLLEKLNPSTALTTDMSHLICDLFFSEVSSLHPEERSLKFVDAVFVLVKSFYKLDDMSKLFSLLFSKVPTLKSPINNAETHRLFNLFEGFLIIGGTSPDNSNGLSGLTQAMSLKERLRLFMFENNIVMQAYEDNPSLVVTTKHIDSNPIGFYTSDKSTPLKTLFARHINYLGFFSQMFALDFYQPLPEYLQVESDAPWWVNPHFIGFLLSSSNTASEGMKALRQKLLTYTEKILPKIMSKRKSALNQQDGDASPGDIGEPEDASVPIFEKILTKALFNPQASLNSIGGALKDLYLNASAPSISDLRSLRDLCALWNAPMQSSSDEKDENQDGEVEPATPFEAFKSGRVWFLAERLQFLFHLLHVLSYVHQYDESASLTLGHGTYTMVREDPINMAEIQSFIRTRWMGVLTEASPTVLGWRAAASFNNYRVQEYQFIFNLPAVPVIPYTPQPGNWQAKLPDIPRSERLELVQVLMNMAMDVINEMPKDHLLPIRRLSVPVEDDYISATPTTRSLDALAPSETHMKHLALVTVQMLVFACEVFGSISSYPAPSLARPAMEWLSTRFWKELPTLTDLESGLVQYNTLTERQAMHCFLTAPIAWVPIRVESLILAHFHDPIMLLKLIQGLRTRCESDHDFRAIEGIRQQPERVVLYIRGLLRNYVRHLQTLINDPAAWERDNIISISPEPKTQHLNPDMIIRAATGRNPDLRVSYANKFSLPPRPKKNVEAQVLETLSSPSLESSSEESSQDDPEDTSVYESFYNETLEWTDWDELEWFTRPGMTLSPNIRCFPLDNDAATTRLKSQLTTTVWDSHHPFVHLVDPKSIPKDEEERLSTLSTRIPTYFKALGDVTLAATDLLTLLLKQEKRLSGTLPNDTHPQLIMQPYTFNAEYAVLEMPYILMSHVFCRKKVDERKTAYHSNSSSTPISAATALGQVAHCMVDIRSDLPDSIIQLPELRDLAWKLLCIAPTAMGPSVSLQIQNSLTLQALMELEFANPKSTRLQTSQPHWLTDVAPALTMYGNHATHIASPAAKKESHTIMWEAAKSIQHEVLKDIAAIFDLTQHVEETPYPEFADFMIEFLRPEDYALRPRVYEARFCGGAPPLTLLRNPQADQREWRNAMVNRRKVIVDRFSARLHDLRSLARGFPDFFWDELLFDAVAVPSLSAEERQDRIKVFRQFAPPIPTDMPPAWSKMEEPHSALFMEASTLIFVQRDSPERYPPPTSKGGPTDYKKPLFNDSKTIDFKTPHSPISDWKHAMHCPSVLRLASAVEWAHLTDQGGEPTLDTAKSASRWMNERLHVSVLTTLTQAVSTPLRACRFITDPFYLSYLNHLTDKVSGPLQMRVATLLTKTGLFESSGLTNSSGVLLTPMNDIIDQAKGNIVLGLETKAHILEGRYLKDLRETLHSVFKVVYLAYSIHFMPIVYATLMTHDPMLRFATFKVKSGSGILFGMHADLVNPLMFISTMRELEGLFRYQDEAQAALAIVRWQVILNQSDQASLPSAIPLITGQDPSALIASASSLAPPPIHAAPSAASSSKESSLGPVSPYASFINIIPSRDLNRDYEFPETFEVPPSQAVPISQFPSLFATYRAASNSHDRDSRQTEFPWPNTINRSDAVTPIPLLMMSRYKMLKEEDQDSDEDNQWIRKKVSQLGILPTEIKRYGGGKENPWLTKFTKNTDAYFLSNGVTGGSHYNPHFNTTAKVFQHFWVVPYNRVVNVWYPNFAFTVPATSAAPTAKVLRFSLSELGPNQLMHLRLGFATRSALEIINAHPLLSVGDVPGSFSFSPIETGAFEEGIYYPIAEDNWLRMRYSTSVVMEVDMHSRTFQFHNIVGTSSHRIAIHHTTMLHSTNDEEYLPVLSFFGPTSFLLEQSRS